VQPGMLMLGNAGLAYYLFPDTLARHLAAASREDEYALVGVQTQRRSRLIQPREWRG